MQGVSKPSADSDIRFEVWLPQPAGWNRKFLSTGEGGFAGQLNYQRNGLDGAMDELLRRGYATASTDTGHRSSDQWWAIGHPEKAADYLYRAKHVTTVAAKAIIAAYYGQAPSHSYFSSCSNGGRQGLIEAQRYPDDFDGLIIGAPWNFQSHSNAGFIWDAQALAAPGAAIPAEKLPAITAAVVAACDKNDGLADGVIADPRSCKFDPRSLTCHGGDGNDCLTPPQVAALQKIYDGPSNPRTGESIFPGFARGSESGWTGMVRPATAGSGLLVYFSNLVYQNPEWDLRSFNFDSDMTHADQTVGRLGNATSTDYSAAIRRGVKIIQYHGWNDQTLQPDVQPAVLRASREGERRPREDAGFLPTVHGSGHGALQRRDRRVEFWWRGAADSAGARRGARSADRHGELGRTRHAAGSIHRDKVHGQPGRHEDRAVHTSGVSLSGRAAVQGDGRSE